MSMTSLAVKAAAAALVVKVRVVGPRVLAAGGRAMEELIRQAACMGPVML
jgi:hypothetical protein